MEYESNQECEYIPEKTLIGFNVPMNSNEINIAKKKLNTICIIFVDKEQKGTGFFCRIDIKGRTKKVLFTNNHVLDENLIKIGSKINIFYNNSYKNIEITKNRFTCTDKYIDYTCIEILPEDDFSNFLKVDSDIQTFSPFKTYKNDKIVIIQYPHIFSPDFGFGKIEKYCKKSNLLFYSIPTISGSSGSPILSFNRNLDVIGIHCGSPKDSLTTNVGKFLKEILDDIEKKL
jgi:hypothetical protein